MSAKAIREYDGKQLLTRWLSTDFGQANHAGRMVLLTPACANEKDSEPFASVVGENQWLLSTRLVVKVDQLIKRRGKCGLVKVNVGWNEVVEWVLTHMGKSITVEGVTGILDHFLVEPFVPHPSSDEYYLCIQSFRESDELLFTHEGGVDVGDVDSKGLRLSIELQTDPTEENIIQHLLINVIPSKQTTLAKFIISAYKLFQDLNFVYMEINPLVMTEDGTITPLDMAAKIDETARFINSTHWGAIDFPAPFGREEFPEEAFIRQLDQSSGASLKLTILNEHGRIWTMVAGGGASVVYADTICDLGFGNELANYGEYSGAPSLMETYQYAKTVFSLMTRHKDDRGKVLIIGGGIANFTDVAATFKGIQKALKEFSTVFLEQNVKVWVRRAGPNYQEGLRNMRQTADDLGLHMHLYGPETHMTAIVPMALGVRDVSSCPEFDRGDASPDVCPNPASPSRDLNVQGNIDLGSLSSTAESKSGTNTSDSSYKHLVRTADADAKCVIYGLQPTAVQGMLDFDFMCSRKMPSVACMVFPFSGNHYTKFYWGTDEILIPVYATIQEAVTKHSDASIMINFASFRSVFDTVSESLEFCDILKTIVIIAEGVPESQTRLLIHLAKKKGVGIIGPATVGGIKPGCLRIGNTGGMLDNIVMSRLYRPGSVAYVSKSGGMSNELNNIISRNSDGVCEGVAIGGDRYPGSQFLDHLLRYNDNPEVKMMILLGEVGGMDEYAVCEALSSGRITKPLVAWVMGTCANIFPYEVQFGHAGAMARGNLETAAAKNESLRKSGAVVPSSFDNIGEQIYDVYTKLLQQGIIHPRPEPEVPKVPMDYQWAKRLGLIRKPANFISTISDDRGDELTYAGVPISDTIAQDIGIGGVLSLLWFRKRLPSYATKFIEMVLMISADHGPAVSGAHNTIVASRAGKDLVSSLASGLLTIGPRFGGALDEAALMFMEAVDKKLDAPAFVKKMRKENRLIMGIGHKIRTLQNPDMRVKLIVDYAKENFPQTSTLDFALQVEAVTTQKKATLILNVDGAIAACFVDLLRYCGSFERSEADDLISYGCLNGLFVAGRTIGFIGHFIDQKRLKQGLYRHPWDDISYQTDI